MNRTRFHMRTPILRSLAASLLVSVAWTLPIRAQDAVPEPPTAEIAKPAETESPAPEASPGLSDKPAATTETEAPDAAPSEAKPTVADATPPAPDPVPPALETALEDTEAFGKADHTALVGFYAERQFAPLWIKDGKFDGAARAVIRRLENADAYGLDPIRYVLPDLDVGLSGTADPATLANAELVLTVAAMQFAADAQGGIFDPATLGKFMTAAPVRPERKAVIEGLGKADDKVAYLESFNPQHPAFAALKQLLADLRTRTTEETPPEIPDGKSLKPGMSDERVPVLRARLGLPAVTGEGERDYDDATVEAVKAFQENASLDVDGVIGPQTRAALNGGSDITVADVLVNMERWRWVPREMGTHHVWVNIPEYRLRVVSGGTVEFGTRVIVGTSENQTPVFSDEIEYVDVNPYWNVPRSIATKEMMPEIRRDPDFFARRGLEVIYTGGGRDMVIDPRSVDWGLWNPENMPFRFRQPPGNANALGRVKFMFPNKHDVYLHDTPTRNLFSRSARAFSHGCVRVDKPVEFADALLSREEQLNGQRIKHLIGGGENGSLPIKRHVPVHLTYFTVWVDDAGETQKRADIYDYDARMKAAMNLGS